MVGFFRLKPDFVTAYTAEYYPVRAAAFDTQSGLDKNLIKKFRWQEREVQIHIQTPAGEILYEVLEREAKRVEGDLESSESLSRDFAQAFGTGGASGQTLKGRAAALLNFNEATFLERLGHKRSLEAGRLFDRSHGGYLLGFNSLGGGTGSGSLPVVMEYVKKNINPEPMASFAISVVPRAKDFQLGSNLLTSLYYMVKSPHIDGIILTDNLKVAQSPRQGHESSSEDFKDIDRYLHDVLMPLFLAPQPNYNFFLEMDPANVKSDLQPAGKSELIVACFAICPLGQADKRVRNMRHQKVNPSRNGVPELGDMLTKALINPTIEFEQRTARRAIALIAGPEYALSAMNLGTSQVREDFETEIYERVIDPSLGERIPRVFAAAFPGLKDVRMTLLISAPRLPNLYQQLQEALLPREKGWAIEEGETLAGALRRLPEPEIRQLATDVMKEGASVSRRS
jgi:hypothetical protein